MSLSDFAIPARPAALDEPGLIATVLHWLSRADRGAPSTRTPAGPRDGIHAARERGYLDDIGL